VHIEQAIGFGDSIGHSVDTLRALVSREFRMRYKGSFFGVLWAVLSPLGTVVVLQDITEQRHAQGMLAEAEARLREGEALAHIGRWQCDVATGVVQWSDEFHAFHGVDPLDFEGTLDAQLAYVHADDRDGVRATIEHAVKSGRAVDQEYRIVRPDQEVRWLHTRAEPTIDSRVGEGLATEGLHG